MFDYNLVKLKGKKVEIKLANQSENCTTLNVEGIITEIAGTEAGLFVEIDKNKLINTRYIIEINIVE